MMAQAKKNDSKPQPFIWTDDEVELLLKITLEYKTSKAAENTDWESCPSKYGDLLDMFNNQYPSPENAEKIGKEYPHKMGDLSKSVLTSKLKMIRKKFREAVDSGRKSGHGRVVLLYFEVCQEIWGGSPATTTIAGGVETSEIDGLSEKSESESTEGDSSPLDNEDVQSPETPRTTTVKERRDLLDNRLRGYKSEKLKRKLTAENQLLAISQEELQIKKQILERMETTDKVYANNMERLTNNMEKLTESISDAFSFLRHVVTPPNMMPTQQFMPPQMPSYNVPASRVYQGTSSNSGQFSYTESLYSNNNDHLL